MRHQPGIPPCGRFDRRGFLADTGLGFTGLAMGAMLHADGISRASGVEKQGLQHGGPHHPAKAKSVIWIFLSGGVSHLETFDPKPALNQYAGKTFQETPFGDPLKSPLYNLHGRGVVTIERAFPKIFPLQIGYAKRGQSGIEVSDWLPNLATCVDDMAIIRSMYTTDNDHGAEFQMHTGRHALDEKQPCLGSWLNYGLGTLNANLPQFVFLGKYSDNRVKQNFDPDYLGPRYRGVELNLESAVTLPFAEPANGITPEEHRRLFALIDELNRLSSLQYPDDPRIAARLKAYELAFRMQTAVPEALDLARESPGTHRLYGIDRPETAVYGRRLLAARRLAERGVRYTLVYLSDYGEWDSHTKLRENHARSCARVDHPLAGLLKDLKRTGLDQETLVVCATEFGRTPGLETRGGGATGREHHPHGFTVWMAGAGIKKGVVHGATDELGFHAVEHPHYVTDIHATVLNRMGLDSRVMEIPGRKRLEMDHGSPIKEIMA